MAWSIETFLWTQVQSPAGAGVVEGRSGQTARTKSMLGVDAQCTVQKQPRQGAGSRGGSTKRGTATTKRKKRGVI